MHEDETYIFYRHDPKVMHFSVPMLHNPKAWPAWLVRSIHACLFCWWLQAWLLASAKRLLQWHDALRRAWFRGGLLRSGRKC